MANADGEKKRDKAMFRKKESFALGTGGKIFDSDMKKAGLTASSNAEKKSGCAPLLSGDFSAQILLSFALRTRFSGNLTLFKMFLPLLVLSDMGRVSVFRA